MIRSLLKRLSRRGEHQTEEVEPKHVLGFHGDHFLVSLADIFISRSRAFVETGTYFGESLSYVASTHPDITAYSCELDEEHAAIARKWCERFPNAHIENMGSPDFLHWILKEHPEFAQQTVFFHLDAHGYGYKWPLFDEVKLLTSTLPSGYALIDDFRVPKHPVFRYDSYDGQECGLPYILDALAPDRPYQLLTPDYSYHTSSYHPMVGYGLLAWGEVSLDLPSYLQHRFHVEDISRKEEPSLQGA